FFFFFTADDGIRDRNVTGVQTCALPILQEAVIVAARRTPIGAFLGSLSSVSAVDLGVAVVKQLLADTGVAADAVDEVLLGHVLSDRKCVGEESAGWM